MLRQVLALASGPSGLAAPGDNDAAAAAAELLAGLAATCPPEACNLDVSQVGPALTACTLRIPYTLRATNPDAAQVFLLEHALSSAWG